MNIELLLRRWNLVYFQWLVGSVMLLFPIVFLAVPKGESAGVYLLILCGLIAVGWRIRPMGTNFGRLLREYWPVNIAMASLVIAIFINHLLTGKFSTRAYELPSQLACFSLLFWLFLLLPGKCLRNIQWSLIAGALLCVTVLYIDTAGGMHRTFYSFKVPLIPFGNIAMLMGALVIFSIGWNNRNERTPIAIKAAVGFATLYGSYLSQTRGGWIALPLFIGIGFLSFGNMRWRFKLSFLIGAIVLIYGSYMFIDNVHKRVGEAKSDVQQYIDGKNKNTSVGVRLQLWEGSWMLFKENPILGVGPGGYSESIHRLETQGLVTPQAASQPHPHNDLLFHMATLGIFGLLAMLSLYFVPAAYFFKNIWSSDRETRAVAGMGIALCLGYFLYGLTDVMFYWRVSYSFYVILLAVLFACLVKRKAFLVSQR